MKSDANRSFIAHFRPTDGTPQSVGTHLEETSELASGFAGKVGLSSLGELMGLLHDLGKYSDAFQTYIHSSDATLKGKIDHSSAGAQLLWCATQDNQSPYVRIAAHMMSLCIASHHNGLIDCLTPAGDDMLNKRMTKPIELTCRGEEEE